VNSLWLVQIKAVVRLELRKTFFARRGLWIYLLALAPVALFVAQAVIENHVRGDAQNAAPSIRRVTDQDLSAIGPGMSLHDVIATLGPPHATQVFDHPKEDTPGHLENVRVETLTYPSEAGEVTITLENNAVTGTQSRGGITFAKEIYVFSAAFQFFFIRLAVFFGCLGIFMNLIRGEMLDRTLHYYLLAPVRREVLLLGKYLAGLLASIVIFTVSEALQLCAASLAFDSNTLHHFLYQQHGFAQVGAYLAVTVLACVGYGSVFLAAGLLFKNPIVPAVLVLIWEAANPLLPSLLKKISIIYYLKSMCPVQVPIDPGMPKLFALLVSNTEPVSGVLAACGLIALSAIVLYVSCRRVRPLEINYTTE
jgi:ABC-type transport system involved in multi-copper enzyme maturation permease subunit